MVGRRPACAASEAGGRRPALAARRNAQHLTPCPVRFLSPICRRSSASLRLGPSTAWRRLAVRFLYLDYHEPVGLPNGAPVLCALRLVPRSDDPKLGRAVVNFVLFGPGHLDDRGAIGSPAFAASRSKRVEAVLSRLLMGHARKLPEGGSVLGPTLTR
jgi:hypothetical protein